MLGRGLRAARFCANRNDSGAQIFGDRLPIFLGVDAIAEELDGDWVAVPQGKPVALGVLTYPNWDYPSVQETGEIAMPLPRMQPDGGHAVCVVGYELRADVPGRGSYQVVRIVFCSRPL